MSKTIASDISDVQDDLFKARSMVECLFMAAASLGSSSDTNAIQVVADLAKDQLEACDKALDRIRERSA